MPLLKENSKKGSLFIDLLILILLISIISFLAFIVINPVNRAKESLRNSRTRSATNIISAIEKFYSDNENNLPQGLSAGMAVTQIGTANYGCDISCDVASSSACVNLNSSLSKYLTKMPIDVSDGTQFETKYYVVINSDKLITVGVCNTDVKVSNE